MASRTQLFEWVKDGNMECLQTYFVENLRSHPAKIRKVFNIRDKQRRSIIHWAAYLGQDEVLRWWLLEYIDVMTTLNVEDNQNYTPLELASVRGYSDDYNAEQQFRTVSLILDFRVKIKITKGKPTPLHWAFYYCNISLIELLIMKEFDQIYSKDDQGYYPIDYLFFENKDKMFKKNVVQAFVLTVQVYVRTTNKNQKFRQQLDFRRKNYPFFYHHNSTQFLKCDDDRRDMVEIEPHNVYTPDQYNLKIHSQKMAMKSMKLTLKHDNLINGTKHVLNKQIQNVFLFSQERSIHCESEEGISNQSEPEEEKFPPMKQYREHHNKHRQQTNFDLKNRTRQQGSNQSNFNVSESPIQKRMKERYAIYKLEKSMSNQDNHLETRFLYWSAYSGLPEFVLYFLDRKSSPFMINFQGANAFHAAAANGCREILQIFLEAKYEYIELQEQLGKKKINKKKLEKFHFDRQKCIDLMTTQLPSTALHLAIENEHYDCAKLLLENKASTQQINHRTLRPFELKLNEQIKTIATSYVRSNPISDVTSEKSREEIFQSSFVSKGFYYVIQTPGKSNFTKDIVFLQLQNIAESFQKDGQNFEFIILFGPNLDNLSQYLKEGETKPEFFFYVIKLSHNAIFYLAEKNKLQCFNFKTKFICEFKEEEKGFFEFPKDLQIQQLIINTLNQEFDLDKFVLEKLINSHFPLEDRVKSARIDDLWKEFRNATLSDTIRIDTDQIALRPLHAISNYYGPVIGWYFAFVVQMIGWLSGPTLFGLAIGIYMLITEDYSSKIVPVYALFMALWSTLFLEKWKNRTWELKFSWDMHNFKANEPQRVMYTGQFTLDSIKQEICIQDPFTTTKRRIFTDLPVIIFGILMIIALFMGFFQWAESNKNNFVASLLIGSLNGASITILSNCYKLLCMKLVQWENHRFESEQEFSYIVKVFLFEFLNSYITVVYYAIFEEDPQRLAISVGSIVITRGVISNASSNGVPFILYQIKIRLFRRKYNTFSHLANISKIPSQKIANQDYLKEKLDYNNLVNLLTQVEENIVKEPQKLLFDEFTSIAIQFGYITMFSTTFPAAPFFFMGSMYLNLRASLYSYRNIMKRERSIPADSIGIWMNIFIIMNYAATLMNCLVISRANNKQLTNLVGKGSFFRDIVILLATEHIILLIKYILEIAIPDVPGWVERELKRYEYLEKQVKFE